MLLSLTQTSLLTLIAALQTTDKDELTEEFVRLNPSFGMDSFTVRVMLADLKDRGLVVGGNGVTPCALTEVGFKAYSNTISEMRRVSLGASSVLPGMTTQMRNRQAG